MHFSKVFYEALDSLGANKLRSALTMLGIIIGVAAVIAMLAIGNGANASITSEIEAIGTNVLYIFSGGDAKNPEPMTLADAEAIADVSRAPSVSSVAPILQGNLEVSIPGEATNTSIIGVTEDYFTLLNLTISEGVLITQTHLDQQAAVVIIGIETAEDLFGTTTGVVGETVRMRGQVFTIIGIQEEQGGGRGGSSDNIVLVPLTTAQARLIRRENPGQVDQIYVQAHDAESVDTAIEEIANILRAQHISTLGEDDFKIFSTASLLESASQITGTLTLFLGGIAGVSLLVGGIGIMNIMLVSVIERTREIGLRKALGARKRDILLQFLIEALVMSMFGGLLGIAAGWGISALVELFAGEFIIPIITLDSVMLAVLFSLAVGIFFGIYPANRAAQLEPVEALRAE